MRTRLLNWLRQLTADHLAWFGAGLGIGSLALVGFQLLGPALPVTLPSLDATPILTPTRTPPPTATPRPTPTPWPTATPRPTHTPAPTATPRPTPTPWPTRTPFPTRTPVPTRTPTPLPDLHAQVATFAERLVDVAAALSTATTRLACRTPTPEARPCG